MNRTEEIYRTLLAELERGDFPVGSRFPSEYWLADRFEANKSTVNKAVSQLVERGLLRRGERGAGTRVVRERPFPQGVITYVGRLNAYTLEILDGVQSAAWSRGYAVEVLSPPESQVARYVELLRPDRTVGIVTAQDGLLDPPPGIEIVYVDSDLAAEAGRNSVNCDNLAAGRLMMAEILRRGHRDIAIFGSMRHFYSRACPFHQRIMGFHAEMNAAGIADAAGRTFNCLPDSVDDAVSVLRQLNTRYPRATLIATESDFSVRLLVQAAQRLGVALPPLTGFGNVTDFPCATVDQQQRRLGEHAVRRLLDNIGHPEPTPWRELLDVSLLRVELIPRINTV